MERKEEQVMNRVLVYSKNVTPRLEYISRFLSNYYGVYFELIPSMEIYFQANEPCKINYSRARLLKDEIWIKPIGLLFESIINQVKTECFKINGITAFFRTEGDTGFDLLAAIFYLITRYEEYLPYQKDIFGRYAHQNSLAYREDFLHLPLVNIWLEEFRKLLTPRSPTFVKPVSVFSFYPTYDIDMAWSYQNKGYIRNFGALVKNLVKGKWESFKNRIYVMKKAAPDPYDAYDWMDELHRKYDLKPFYFFLVALERGEYDRNIDTGNPEFRKLIRTIGSKYETGLHPSWASGDLPSLVGREKYFLEELLDQTIIASRQHYIRFHLPSTFQRLINHGITEEYSMGYGSINGFRSSFTKTYSWYDIINDSQTNLQIHPFCFMDANAFYEQQLAPEKALIELRQFMNAIYSVHGDMTTIWHNNFLADNEEFKGWKEIYEKFIKELKCLTTDNSINNQSKEP